MIEELKKHLPKERPAVSETSAGGVVVKRIGGRVHIALLLTKHVRGDAWVLPKGHVEMQLGESEEQAAVRESKEELGANNLTLKRALGSTHYNFFTERGKVTKTVHYFLIEAGDEELKPQAEEGFLEAKWFTVREALKKITYATDRDIILRAVATGSKARKR
jgi:ADP-ribose pyrophosphatase YjhB (NUDIX family)